MTFRPAPVRVDAVSSSPGRVAGLRREEQLRRRERAENFPVALRVLPRAPRRHLRAVYDVARLIDDIGDEAPGDRLALLDGVDRDLARVWRGGTPQHAPIRRLVPTVRACGLPAEPFHHLVEANRWDVRGRSYVTRDDLLDYCALSAAPVGRLVLAIADVDSTAAVAMADSVCAGLQVVEHCQDVAEDAARDRVYLPERDLAAHGVATRDLRAPAASAGVRRLLAAECDWARSLLAPGAALAASLTGWPRLAVSGYVAGGLAALDSIERVGFDVLAHSPTVRRRDVLRHIVPLLRGRTA